MLQVILHTATQSQIIQKDLELQPTDNYSILYQKVSKILQVSPQNIYCSLQQQDQDIILSEFYINRFKIHVLPAQSVFSDYREKKCDIPVDYKTTQFINKLDDLTTQFNITWKMISQLIQIDQPLIINVLSIAHLDINIEQLQSNKQIHQLLEFGFLRRYFPFNYQHQMNKSHIDYYFRLQDENVDKLFNIEQDLLEQYKVYDKVHLNITLLIKKVTYQVHYANQQLDTKEFFNRYDSSTEPTSIYTSYYFKQQTEDNQNTSQKQDLQKVDDGQIDQSICKVQKNNQQQYQFQYRQKKRDIELNRKLKSNNDNMGRVQRQLSQNLKRVITNNADFNRFVVHKIQHRMVDKTSILQKPPNMFLDGQFECVSKDFIFSINIDGYMQFNYNINNSLVLNDVLNSYFEPLIKYDTLCQQIVHKVNKTYAKTSITKLDTTYHLSQILISCEIAIPFESDLYSSYHFQIFMKYIQQQPQIFRFDKIKNQYKTKLFSNSFSYVSFRFQNDVFHIQFSGNIYAPLQLFIQMFIMIFQQQNLQQLSISDEAVGRVSNIKLLQKNDPVLFGQLKQGMVYSRLCQGNRQPVMTKQSDTSENVYKYFNFTTQKEQYYKCPNSEYPYLSFMVGKHSKNYCLPECAKKSYKGSKYKEAMHNQCLNTGKFLQNERKSTYTFTNRNKFQINGNTMLANEFYQHFDKTYVIHCLHQPTQLLTYYQIMTFIQTLVWQLDQQLEQFIDNFQNFLHQHGCQNQQLFNEIQQFKQNNIVQVYNTFLWIQYIQQYIGEVNKHRLVILTFKSQIPQINYYQDQFKDFTDELILMQTFTTYNPVIIIQEEAKKLIKIIPRTQGVTLKLPQKFDQQQLYTTSWLKDTVVTKYQLKMVNQIVDSDGICKYIVAKTTDNLHTLLPVQMVRYDREIQVADILDSDLFKSQISLDLLLQIIFSDYQEDIDIVYIYKDRIKSIKCEFCIFYCDYPVEQLVQKLPEIQLTHLKYDPFILNCDLYKPYANNQLVLRNVAMSVYNNHIFDLILLNSIKRVSTNQSTEDTQFKYTNRVNDIRKTEKYKIITEKFLIERVEDYVKTLDKQHMPEADQIYPCSIYPSQYFCENDKLLIVQQYEHLMEYLFNQSRCNNINLQRFNQGLFIIISKQQFKKQRNEILIMKKL